LLPLLDLILSFCVSVLSEPNEAEKSAERPGARGGRQAVGDHADFTRRREICPRYARDMPEIHPRYRPPRWRRDGAEIDPTYRDLGKYLGEYLGEYFGEYLAQARLDAA